MLTWLKAFVSATKSPPSVMPGSRVYAVGDIHGRLDLLVLLIEQIKKDAEQFPAIRKVLVFLGDYVDRGIDSRGVIEFLMNLRIPEFEVVCLSGNHEDMMLSFMDNTHIGLGWARNGGDATLASYGIAVSATDPDFEYLQSALLEVLPESHHRFLKELQLQHEEGDYLFVHAGIRPRVKLTNQEPGDLMWIREPFLSSRRDHGKVIVHGHSIRYDAECFPDETVPRRIGIDTGAFHSGKLTCLALAGAERSYIQTGQ